jgi:hypothetical protein
MAIGHGSPSPPHNFTFVNGAATRMRAVSENRGVSHEHNTLLLSLS